MFIHMNNNALTDSDQDAIKVYFQNAVPSWFQVSAENQFTTINSKGTGRIDLQELTAFLADMFRPDSATPDVLQVCKTISNQRHTSQSLNSILTKLQDAAEPAVPAPE